MTDDENEFELTYTAELAKVFKMVNEVRQLSSFVDFFTRRHDALCKRPRTTTEHTNLTHLQKTNESMVD